MRIRAAIADAPHRSPKGLRYGFGVNATVNGIPLHMLQKWMRHAQLSTAAIHADASGEGEQDIAARMWRRGPGSPRCSPDLGPRQVVGHVARVVVAGHEPQDHPVARNGDAAPC